MKTYYVLLVTFILLVLPFNTYAQLDNTAVQSDNPHDRAIKENNFSMEHFIFFAPLFNSPDVLSSDILTGNVVLYVTGNTLCAPCIAFSKSFTAIKNTKYKDTPNFKTVYITTDIPKEIRRIVATRDIKYDYIVPMSHEKMVDIGYLMEYKPTYILVDKTGKVAYKGFGCSHILDQAKETINEKIIPEIDKLLSTDGFIPKPKEEVKK